MTINQILSFLNQVGTICIYIMLIFILFTLFQVLRSLLHLANATASTLAPLEKTNKRIETINEFLSKLLIDLKKKQKQAHHTLQALSFMHTCTHLFKKKKKRKACQH